MKNTIIKNLFLVFFAVVFALFTVGYTQSNSAWSLFGEFFASAGNADDATGYAWTDTFGWFSFNSTNPGAGFGADYGVDVLRSSELGESNIVYLTGYAWSNNMGWLQMDPDLDGAGHVAPGYTTRIDLCTGEVTGWAKVLNMGEDGWLLHAYDDGSSVSFKTMLDIYGTHPNTTGTVYALYGYAWNNTLGWFRYDPEFGGVLLTKTADLQVKPETPLLINPIDGEDTYIDFPNNPLQPTLEWSAFTGCGGGGQKQFRLQITDIGDEGTDIGHFNNPDNIIYDVTRESTSNTHSVELRDPPVLRMENPRKTYWWRVQIFDTNNKQSAWGWEHGYFQTPLHMKPDAEFTNQPADIHAGVEIQFIDQSVAYGGSTIVEWEWNIYWDNDDVWELVTDMPITVQHPLYTFEEDGMYKVILKVTDSDGYSDTVEKEYNVKKQLPIFERIIPR